MAMKDDELIDSLILAFLLQESDHIETQQELSFFNRRIMWFVQSLQRVDRESNKPSGSSAWNWALVRSIREIADNALQRDADGTAPYPSEKKERKQK